jgi:hypothetical protein
MIDVAGDAIEAACRLEKAQPTGIIVLWAFSLGTAMMLYRDGFACRSGEDEWAMHKDAVNQMWPHIEEGLGRYLRTCTDVSDCKIPTKEEFVLETLPGSLNFLSDVRFARTQEPGDMLAALTEKYGENFLSLDHYQMRLLVYVAKRLFTTVGLTPLDPSEPILDPDHPRSSDGNPA